MPGIVMNGIMPTFYKIPITAELVTAVEPGKEPGENPEQETVVYAYLPEVPRPEEGMRPLDNRYIILSCFEAFKQFLVYLSVQMTEYHRSLCTSILILCVTATLQTFPPRVFTYTYGVHCRQRSALGRLTHPSSSRHHVRSSLLLIK
jgi:hypothetical protein